MTDKYYKIEIRCTKFTEDYFKQKFKLSGCNTYEEFLMEMLNKEKTNTWI